MKRLLLCFATGTLLLFSSCTTKLKITDVAYQSIRKVEKADANSRAVTPETGAVIAVSPVIDDYGNVKLVVRNLSDKIMVIDRTKSFFIDYSGQSTMYYDPTIRTSTLTTSGTEGATVNLGAIGSALGIGGAVGTALSGINVGGSNTSGVSKTTYSIDQPVVSIGPNGYIDMGREFSIPAGKEFFKSLYEQNPSVDISRPQILPADSYCTFSVSVCYSLDNGETFNSITSNYYANSLLQAHVVNNGKINGPLRKIYSEKSDALEEPWYIIYFNNNLSDFKDSYYINNLVDYQ